MHDYELRVTSNGWLQRLDPRTKLLLVSCAALLFVAFEPLPALLALLALVHVALLTSHVTPRQIGWVWRQLGRVLLVVALLYPLLARAPGPPLWSWGPFAVTWNGVLGPGHSDARDRHVLVVLYAALYHATKRTGARAGAPRPAV